MKLLLVNYEYPPLGGGAGNTTRYLAAELALMGARVTVLTSAFRGLPRKTIDQRVTIIRIPVGRAHLHRGRIREMAVFSMNAALASLSFARRTRPDVTISFFTIPSGPVGFLLNKIMGIPNIVSLQGSDVPGYSPEELGVYHRVLLPLTRSIWRNAFAVVANSKGLAQLAELADPGIDIPVIPNGVDTRYFCRDQERLKNSTISLLTVGRLRRVKGVDLLLHSLSLLPHNVHLRVVGAGPEELPLKSLAGHLGVSPRVQFVGWLDKEHLRKEYHRADIFVLPSRYEGMANVVLEAMASNLPVVGTRVFGNEELIQDGETGLLVPCEDVQALTEAISELVRDTNRRRKMGRNGLLLVREFTWRRVAEAYLNLAERACQ